MTKRCGQAAFKTWAVTLVAVGTLLVGSATTALASQGAAFELNRSELVAEMDLPSNTLLAKADEPVLDRVTVESADTVDDGACPFSFGLSYALYTDYIFRMVNFSEYPGEGREKLNHQLTVSMSYDLGDWGTIGYDTWFEWYAAQEKINGSGDNLQEVDYVIYWTKGIDPIMTDFTIGYTFYLFPNTAKLLRQDGATGNNNDDRTNEYWFELAHNDAWMWKWAFPDNEEGVLNPTFLYAHDVGSILGYWMELGISHDFTIPGVENLTITPGYSMAFQCGYWADGAYAAGDTWSLVTEYDLTPVLQLPEWAGTLSITGEIYWTNPYSNLDADAVASGLVVEDTLWGGMTVNWAWGG